MSKEINTFKKMEKIVGDMMYPGYPFVVVGYADLEKENYFLNGTCYQGLKQFSEKFDSLLCYHMVGSNLAHKGNWLESTYMAEIERFIKADFDDFYIDNYEVTKLWFATYSALRYVANVEKDKKPKFLWFYYNGEADFVEVKLFRTAEELEQFYKDYWEEWESKEEDE